MHPGAAQARLRAAERARLRPGDASRPAAAPGRQPAPAVRAAGPAAGGRGARAVRHVAGPRRRRAARAVRADGAPPLGVLVAERRGTAAAVPRAGPAQPAAAGDPGRADPGPGPGGAAQRLGRRPPAERRGHHGPAGHPRDGRGRGAVRPGGGDAGRPCPRRGGAGRAGGTAQRRGGDPVQQAGSAGRAARRDQPARRRAGRDPDGGPGHGPRRPAHRRLRRRRPGALGAGAGRPERLPAQPGGCPARPARPVRGRAGRYGNPRTDRRTAMSTAAGRLIRTALRLMARDPGVLSVVFAFPVVTMLIIGGAFGTAPDPAFGNVNPAHWYVASYLTVVIAATGLVMLPVHLASYRERGVLRRFAAAGFPRWSFAIAQLVVGLLTTAVACALLLAVAAPVYGVPAVHDAWRVAVALPLGAVAFVSLGVLLGSLLPSARSAQAVGLLLFFPSFLLGAGGPPPHVMGSVVRQVAGPLPLTLLTNAVRAPWP